MAAEAKSVRLTIGRGRMFARCEAHVLEAFERALAKCRMAGIAVDEGSLEPILELTDRVDKIGTFPSVEVAATLAQLGVTSLDGIDPKRRARIEAGRTIVVSGRPGKRRLDHAQMQLGRQPSSTSTDTSVSSLFFWAAACW